MVSLTSHTQPVNNVTVFSLEEQKTEQRIYKRKIESVAKDLKSSIAPSASLVPSKRISIPPASVTLDKVKLMAQLIANPFWTKPSEEACWTLLLSGLFPRVLSFPSNDPQKPWFIEIKYSDEQLFDQDIIINVDGGGLDVIQEDNPDDDEPAIGTAGLGPCIAIIGIGFDDNGKRVSGLYHWTGPNQEQDPNKAAKVAFDVLNQRISDIVSRSDSHIDIKQIKYFLLGSDEGSRQDLKALQTIGCIPEEHIVPIPYEVDGGWDVVIEDNTIYFGTQLIN